MTVAKWGKKICVEKYVLGVSLTRKAKLKRMLAGYLVKTSMKGGRRRPVRLSNKGGKHLMFSGLGIGLPYWKSCSLGRIGPRPCGSYDLYTVRLGYYRSLALI